MQKKAMLFAVGSAALLAVAGAARPEAARAQVQLAQATQDAEPRSPSPNAPGGALGAPPEKMEEAPGSLRGLEGKDVLNMEGDKIGQIEAIAGDALIVSVGGFLGIGERKVALSRGNVNITGVGDAVKIQTTMTKDQLRGLPEYTGPTTKTAPPGTTR
jgi:hypothetical protein